MSWDVSVESPSGPMGTPDEVRRKISAAVKGVDWEDPTLGVVEQGGYSLEFSILGGEDDAYDEDEEGEEGDDAETGAASPAAASEGPITGFIINVRGTGEPLPTLVQLCKAYGWTLSDGGSGEPIDLDNPSDAGWREFQAFRDGIADRLQGGPKKGFFGRLFGRKG